MNYTSRDAQDWAAELRKGNRNKTKDRSAEMCDQLATILRSMEEAKAVACPYCDDTGDVHSIDGEWRGKCTSCHPPADSGEAKDAARYRYIRESGSEFVHYIGGGSHGIYEESRLDGLVDAAIDEEMRFKAAMTAESREN